jgi:hypothetical protein
MSIADRY